MTRAYDTHVSSIAYIWHIYQTYIRHSIYMTHIYQAAVCSTALTTRISVMSRARHVQPETTTARHLSTNACHWKKDWNNRTPLLSPPEWILLCVFRELDVENAFEHTWHANGLSPTNRSAAYDSQRWKVPATQNQIHRGRLDIFCSEWESKERRERTSEGALRERSEHAPDGAIKERREHAP